MTDGRPIIFLHIGAMKTGTTFLQSVMLRNKEHLAAAGYLFPGDTWAQQVRAVQDITDGTGGDPKVQAEAAGAWDAMAAQMLDHPGHASILSMEFLSFAREKHVKRVVTSLGAAEVHVVLTVRDTTDTIPAQWQTRVHNGSTMSWPEFMAGVRKAAGPAGSLGRFSTKAALSAFKRAQDIGNILGAWGRHVPPERLHVVTVPPSGSERGLLWERFAGVLDLDPGVCSEPPARANESLGYASTELLRRVNEEVGRLRPSDYTPTLKEYLALGVLSQRSREESRARIDRATCEFGLAWNERVRKAIVGAGAVLAGDLEDLPTTFSESHVRNVDDAQVPPTDGEILSAAGTAVEAMHRLVVRRARRLRKRGAAVDLDVDGVSAAADAWSASDDPVAAAVGDIAELARTAVDLRRRLRA